MKTLPFAISLTFLLVVLVTSVPHAMAQSGGNYDLTWNTIDGGGAMSATGGAFELSGTIGQMDAGNMSGGTFTLTGGFWHDSSDPLFLPLIDR